MLNRVVAALLVLMVTTPALSAETRPWNVDGATIAPVPDESRSGHWWWPERPSGDAAHSEAWGNRGVVYRNLPPIEMVESQPEQPAPPPDPPWTTAHPRIVFNNVLFERDSAEIGPGSHGIEAVDKLIAHMEKNPHDTVVLEGHTCDIGSAAYNLALGQRRADAVRDHMIANGIDPGRVSAVSYGLERPAVSNNTPMNQALNRRVVFRYYVVWVDRCSPRKPGAVRLRELDDRLF